MKLFPDTLFKKKKSPFSEVESLLTTGVSPDEIIERLKKKYNKKEIEKAIEKAKIKIGVTEGVEVPNFLKPPLETKEAIAPKLEEVKKPEPTLAKEEISEKLPEEEGGEKPKIPKAPWETVGAKPPEISKTPPPETGPYTLDDYVAIAESVAEGIRNELNRRLDRLSERVEAHAELSKKLDSIIVDIEEIKGKYATMLERSEELRHFESELQELKGSTEAVLGILKTTLPVVLKTLKEIKEKGPKKRKKEVEHLI
jgi:hypothetical protein